MKHVFWCLLALLALPFACGDDSCDPSSCGAGSVCRADGTCGPVRTLREPCEVDGDCEAGLFCLVAPAETETGSALQCSRSTGEPGEPCGTASPNAVLPCAPGSVCVYRRAVEVSSFASDDIGSVAFWSDTREGFIATLGPREDMCVTPGSLARGGQCNDDSDCALGLICHDGYYPSQCQPQSGLDQPCTLNSDCVSDYCQIPYLQEDYDPNWESCALADPSCDIRTDPSCAHWLSCQVCRPRNELIDDYYPPDAGAPDAAAPSPPAPGPAGLDAGAPDPGAPDAGAP